MTVADHDRGIRCEELGEKVLGEPGGGLLGIKIHRPDEHVGHLPRKGAHQPGHPDARTRFIARGPTETAAAAGRDDKAAGTAPERRPDRTVRGGQGRWGIPVHRRHPQDAVRPDTGRELICEHFVGCGKHPHGRAVLLQHGRQCQPDTQSTLDDGEPGTRQRSDPSVALARGEGLRERARRRQCDNVDDEPPQRCNARLLTIRMRQ